MITTPRSYRNELQATETPTTKLPSHALPKGAHPDREIPTGLALGQIDTAQSGFLGLKVATLVSRVL